MLYVDCQTFVLNLRMSNVHIKFFWLLFSIRYCLSHCAQGTVLCEIVGHERNVNTLRGTNCLFPCPGSDYLRLANCPAVLLSYFHCGFVMKYSRRVEPSIRLSKMFEPFLWLEMTNLRAVFG